MTLANKLGTIGVDEVGTGSLCGPVLVCAVLVPAGYGNPRVRDSKQVGREEMARLATELMRETQWCCVQASAATINKYGPREAWCYAVCEAVFRLRIKCGIIKPVIIDGNVMPDGLFNATTLVKGDSKYIQIAAAAIIAKYHRLRIMRAMSRLYPEYGLDTSDGYGTNNHRDALRKHGPTPEHRVKATATLLNNANKKRAVKLMYG